jgi:hypothetical protein
MGDDYFTIAREAVTPVKEVSQGKKQKECNALCRKSAQKIALDGTMVPIHASLIAAEPFERFAYFLSRLQEN